MTDSAGGGSQWSTGKKTLASRISQAPTDDPAVAGSNVGYETALEIAKRLGKRTGNVTTSEVTDATPAAMSAHISERDCKGPEATRTLCPTETKAAGGLGSIAEQQIDLRMDVLLGGGGKDFRQTLDNSTRTVFDYAAGEASGASPTRTSWRRSARWKAARCWASSTTASSSSSTTTTAPSGSARSRRSAATRRTAERSSRTCRSSRR